MKKAINTLVADKIILVSTLVSSVFFIASLGCIAFYFSSFPLYIPLFHQIRWGVERLGRKIDVFLPPLYVGILMSANLVFSAMTYEKMPLVARIIAITNLLLNVILFLFTIRTIQLVL